MFSLVSSIIFLQLMISFGSTNGWYIGDVCHQKCVKEEGCQANNIKSSCHYVFNKSATWEENKKFCKTRNMTMVKLPQKIMIEEFVKEISTTFNSDIWLGGQLTKLDKWMFVNNVTLEDTFGKQASKINDDDHLNQCGVVLYINSGKDIKQQMVIKKENCSEKHHFICRFDDWNGAKSFYFSDSSADWYMAQSRCEMLNGKLLYLTQRESLHILKPKFLETQNQTLFIGLTKGTWQWEDGEEISSHIWRKRGPGYGECLMMNVDGTFSAEGCNKELLTVCESNKASSSPINAIVCPIIVSLLSLIVLFIICRLMWNILRRRKTESVSPAEATCTILVSTETSSNINLSDLAWRGNDNYQTWPRRCRIEDRPAAKLPYEMEIIENSCYEEQEHNMNNLDEGASGTNYEPVEALYAIFNKGTKRRSCRSTGQITTL